MIDLGNQRIAQRRDREKSLNTLLGVKKRWECL